MGDRNPASPHFDALETRSADERNAAQMQALIALAHEVRSSAPHYSAILAGCALDDIKTPADLMRLPVLRKSELAGRQARTPPFGGLTKGSFRPARIFASPGGIYEPETLRSDYWRFGRALWATGLRPGDLVHNSFSYHFTPAGMIMESGAHAVGASVFPAGTGHTEQQAETASRLKPACYTGTPDYLKTILDLGAAQGHDLSSLRMAHVSGGPLTPALRGYYADRNIAAYQSLATADCGLIAYETTPGDGLVVDEHVIVEVVEPGSGKQVEPGAMGELVVTVLNPDYPLIRFATGDLTALLPGLSPCGRTAPRIKGWLGRADQSLKVRGLFVHPSQVTDVLRRHDGIERGRLIVSRQLGADIMTLHVAPRSGATLDEAAIAASLQSVTKLKGEIVVVDAGALANDGLLIEDAR